MIPVASCVSRPGNVKISLNLLFTAEAFTSRHWFFHPRWTLSSIIIKRDGKSLENVKMNWSAINSFIIIVCHRKERKIALGVQKALFSRRLKKVIEVLFVWNGGKQKYKRITHASMPLAWSRWWVVSGWVVSLIVYFMIIIQVSTSP